MRRFFAVRIEDGIAHFSRDELLHMKKVLRMKTGDKIIVPEGRGEWLCELCERDGELFARLLERRGCDAEPHKQITLYLAYTKSDKMEISVQKAVELGVSAVCPFICARCVRVPDEQSAAKANWRMARIAHEAVKQCGRASDVKVDMPVSFETLLNKIQQQDLCVFAYEKSNVALKTVFQETGEATRVGLIVGPEGGFTDEEAQKIAQTGARTVSLGTRILRAETAAIALMAIASYEMEN